VAPRVRLPRDGRAGATTENVGDAAHLIDGHQGITSRDENVHGKKKEPPRITRITRIKNQKKQKNPRRRLFPFSLVWIDLSSCILFVLFV
jgi:hypothetical protein